MTKYLTQNSKMRKSGGAKFAIFNWGIPAYKTKTGKIICKWAGDCIKPCYANQKTYTWPVVRDAYHWRWEQSLQDDFVSVMNAEISKIARRKSVLGKQLVIRIHDSGDYYSRAYLQKWIEIMERNSGVQFYAYTKSVLLHQKLAKAGLLPANYKWIQSEGGTEDKYIDYSLPHARVFLNSGELALAGYEDASHDDSIAFKTLTGKIGLVYHGADNKKWETNNATA